MRVLNTLGDKVETGPFSGVTFTKRHVFGAPIAKLLGTYEKELHPYIARALQGGGLVLNVGGAEGYYAIGCAVVSPTGTVIVYESLEEGRSLIRALADENGVRSRIEIRGTCEEGDLFEYLSRHSPGLLLMDVEGAELALLSERVIRLLASTVVIVESHDFVMPGCLGELINRMSGTHETEVVGTRDRQEGDFPLDLRIPRWTKLAMMSEGRPGKMDWVIAQPRRGKGQP